MKLRFTHSRYDDPKGTYSNLFKMAFEKFLHFMANNMNFGSEKFDFKKSVKMDRWIS